MGLVIHNEKITPEFAMKLIKICPFGALEYEDNILKVNSGCKLCKMCVKNSGGAVEFERPGAKAPDLREYSGIAVFAESTEGKLHNVSLELLGKARELAKVCSQSVSCVLIGSGLESSAKELLHYGADKVYTYDNPGFAHFTIEPYTAAFEDFIRNTKPASVLVGATNMGRTLAPRAAARFKTGLTADCTSLKIDSDGKLIQIRPAFGGNIMAQIITPRTRPQMCTVRYKVFSKPEPKISSGEIIPMTLPQNAFRSHIEILSVDTMPKEVDLSEAEIVVAAGRGIKSKSDLKLVYDLAGALGGSCASTRPLVECGWFDPKSQIGLSGRTVNAKLIITAGVSGSVQFAAGMKGSAFIVAVNSDRNAPIFDIAHVGIVGDLYDVIPELLDRIKEGKANV